jgi:hypothetical protein
VSLGDGRQRFETILRFQNNQFALTARGLYVLKQLKGLTYEDFLKSEHALIDKFLDAKIRVIEFKLANDPPLLPMLEDRVKKEIFSRYNSGITPLTRSEIDNAVYDKDDLNQQFKSTLKKNPALVLRISETFFKLRTANGDTTPLADIMGFIRRFLVLPLYPINQYAHGHDRTDILKRLYQKLSDDCGESSREIVGRFFEKIDFLGKVRMRAEAAGTYSHRLALECFLWGFGVLDQEERSYSLTDDLADCVVEFLAANRESYADESTLFRKAIAKRFAKTAEFFIDHFQVDFSVYVNADDEARECLRNLRNVDDTMTKLSELEKLRLNKPEPSRSRSEDIARSMLRNRFLVRPSYQRKEVMNTAKMSAIIESVLLGITLPALFVFKRIDGTSEVIDGQQRILTLLGYIGKEYIDENGKLTRSRNHNFSLRNLRILRELERQSFDDLADDQRERILDFPFLVVEIDEAQNPNFNPIDLFIRLNDKPFPIREHSFEMWNSWVDADIISKIKDVTKRYKEWIFIRRLNKLTDRDRMENEELITSLAFLEYLDEVEPARKKLDIYQLQGRMYARLTSKTHMSSVLQQATEQPKTKALFLKAVGKAESFLRKIKLIVLDTDKSSEELSDYLRKELDIILQASRNPGNFKRTKQDFYFLWLCLGRLNTHMVQSRRQELRIECGNLFGFIRDVPTSLWDNSMGQREFEAKLESIEKSYGVDKRRVAVSDLERVSLMESQGNRCGISGAPLFLGDDIEIDHIRPLAIGGKDERQNLQLAHASENKKKGAKEP